MLNEKNQFSPFDFSVDDQEVGSLVPETDIQSEWSKIESAIKNELGINFYIDFLKDFLIQNDKTIVSKPQITELLKSTMGHGIKTSDINVIIDYLMLYELLLPDTSNTYYVSIQDDDSMRESLLRNMIRTIV